MKILAVDASTAACSAAVYAHGEVVERLTVASRKHIELLKPMVLEVMAGSELDFKDLDGLAFAVGPGSFAGLRIACGFIQGLGAGLDLPIAPISTLAALAYSVLEEHPEAKVMPMLDAKMNEVYWAIYALDEDKQLINIAEDQVNTLEEIYALFAESSEPVLGIGDGWTLDSEAVEKLNATMIVDRHYPRAGDIALLAKRDLDKGLGLYADQVSPVYLRHNIALTIEEQQALRAAKAEAEESL